MRKVINKLYVILPLFIFLVIWEIYAGSSRRASFLFSSPIKIFKTLFEKISNGELIYHFFITGIEAFAGLILGVTIGSIVGFLLLYYPKVSRISNYYVVALSSIPIFALAPMIIIWFNTGISMKIAMAFFSTVFVAVFQAYQGGQNVSIQDANFFKLNGASDKQKFWKLTIPYSIDWLIQSLKLNAGLSILGAFIGEFIASESGLGYIIFKSGSVYDVSYVLAAVICIIILTLLFNFGASLIEKNKIKILRKFAVDKATFL